MTYLEPVGTWRDCRLDVVATEWEAFLFVAAFSLFVLLSQVFLTGKFHWIVLRSN